MGNNPTMRQVPGDTGHGQSKSEVAPGYSLVEALKGFLYDINIDTLVSNFAHELTKIRNIYDKMRCDYKNCCLKAECISEQFDGHNVLRCVKHSQRLDKATVTSLASKWKHQEFEIRDVEDIIVQCQIIYQLSQSEFLSDEVNDCQKTRRAIDTAFDRVVNSARDFREKVAHLKDHASYEEIRGVMFRREKVNQHFMNLHTEVGKCIALKYSYSLFEQYKELSRPAEDVKGENYDDDIRPSTRNLRAVTILSESFDTFIDCEKYMLERIVKTKLEERRKKEVHNILKEFDRSYDPENFTSFKLELSKNNSCLELLNSMKDRKLPDIKGLSFTYATGMNGTHTGVFNEFFKNCVPDTIRELDIVMNTKNTFEVEGINSLLPKVSERLLIVKSDLDGKELKDKIQRCYNVKEIELLDCLVRKINAGFKLEKKQYALEKLTLNRCYFNGSHILVKNTLRVILQSLVKTSIKNTLKVVELKVNMDSDITEQQCNKMIENLGLEDAQVNIEYCNL